jgi:hypothetical protein
MKTYTINGLEKLSRRQLQRLAAKPDKNNVIVYYNHPKKKYSAADRCATIPAHTETICESLHEHVRNEQYRRATI